MTQRQKNPVAIAALGVAVLSLLVALGGGVYAAAKIDGADLKNRSVAGKKIKNDTLTGKQINEATLSRPSSAPAGDFKRVRFEQTVTSGRSTKPVLSVGPLLVSFECAHDVSGWFLRARTSGGPTSWYLGANYETDVSNGASPFTDNGTLGVNDTELNSAALGTGGYYREIGSAVFSNSSRKETVTLNYAVYITRDASSQYCNLAGTAVRTVG